MNPKRYTILLLLTLALACSKDGTGPEDPGSTEIPPAAGELDPFQQNTLLGRGINLGNALEGPSEGEWGVTLERYFFEEIAAAGFNSVRIPIRWSAHAPESAPYTIDPAFLSRVNWAIDQAFANNLLVIINFHHYDEIFADPGAQRERFLSLWGQVAEYFSQRDGKLIFEVLNEPHDNLRGDGWNLLLADAITLIRQSNPGRTLMAGPDQYNSIGALGNFQLPADDNMIVTVHYYSPFQFTHQGAEWVDGSNAWLGTTWLGTPDQRSAVQADLGAARNWGTANNRPLNLGEFGAYSRADMNSRATWTTFVARSAEGMNMSWSYWEFCSGFGAYDNDARVWRTQLLNALIPLTP